MAFISLGLSGLGIEYSVRATDCGGTPRNACVESTYCGLLVLVNVKQLIAALGGPAIVAARLGVSAKVAGMWGIRNSVPSEQQVGMWNMAQEKGLHWRPAGAENFVLVERRSERDASASTPLVAQ